MNNFGTVYCYEVKKILSRKLTGIVFLICVCCVLLFTLADLSGNYYVDGEVVDTHYHMFQVDQGYRRALSGRALDQQLLEEMAAAYQKIPAMAERYNLTDEYQTYARPYSEIFNLVRLWTQQWDLDRLQAWEPDEGALYGARMENLEKEWQAQHLSDAEKAFWREQEAKTQTPLVYYYHEGYRKIISHGINTIGLLVLLFVCICMSSVFAEEHARRTDQLILSSAKGKSVAYWAKLAAGVSVSGVCAVALSAVIVYPVDRSGVSGSVRHPDRHGCSRQRADAGIVGEAAQQHRVTVGRSGAGHGGGRCPDPLSVQGGRTVVGLGALAVSECGEYL